MRVTTFYSYKGGLGRTLMLSWVARAFAAEGRRVVALDLDLEAPGLPFKLGFTQDSDLGPGVLDLILRFQRGDEPPTSIDPWLRAVPNFDGLYLLPAGPPPSATYWRDLSTISWRELFVESQGARFFTWLRERIEESVAKPDELLIDARTGVTELGGAALSLLADQVLALVGMSPEGIYGSREVLRAVVTSATSVRRREPRIGIVLSRVPASLATPDLQRHRRAVRDQLRSGDKQLDASLNLDLPLVVRSESQLEINEQLALGSRSIRVHEDYRSVFDWVHGAAVPLSAPGVWIGGDPSVSALRASIELQRRQASEAPGSYQPELAASLSNLAASLANEGRVAESLIAIEEANSIYRELLASGRDLHAPDLARSLSNLSERLGDIGRRDEALMAIEEATTLYRALARGRSDVFAPDLARSLNNLSVRLSELGRRDEALLASEEATALYRTLARTHPDAFTPDLARSLYNLSADLSNTGRREEALTASEEATRVFRALAGNQPDSFTPDLARSLVNLSVLLSELGRREEALTASEEATALYRAVARTRPDTFTPNLARSLHNLSVDLRNLERREEALTASAEATNVFRALARTQPDSFGPELARSLNNLSVLLRESDRHAEALTAIEESTAIYRVVASTRPDAFTHDRATSLCNLSVQLSDLGRREDALTAIEEATTLYRALARARPDAFTPDLARSCGIRSVLLSALNRAVEGLVASEEATRLIREPLRRSPNAMKALAGAILSQYVQQAAALKREPDAQLVSEVRDLLGGA